MSKRNHASRRKAYGRRQHEVQERTARGVPEGSLEDGLDLFDATATHDRFGLLDARGGRLRWTFGD